MIVGFSGKAGSGKDTIAREISNKLIEEHFRVSRFAFANTLKIKLSIALGIPDQYFFDTFLKNNYSYCSNDMKLYRNDEVKPTENIYTIRELMQKYGTSMREEFGEDFWVKRTFKDISDYCAHDDIVFITDVRFKNEFKAIKDRNGIVININNPSITSNSKHISETDLDDIEKDYYFNNDWTNNPKLVEKYINDYKDLIKKKFYKTLMKQ